MNANPSHPTTNLPATADWHRFNGLVRDLVSAISACDTEETAIRRTLQCAAEALDTDLSIYVPAGGIVEPSALENQMVMPMLGKLSGQIILARAGDGFDPAEEDLARSMVRALSVFQPGAHINLQERLDLQDDLARALDGREIVAHFQPKIDLRSARVIGVEALARWTHPERGPVSPGEFLPLAEAGGHMRALTERMIEFSTRAAGDWWHSGLGLQLSVNLSPSIFSESTWRLDKLVAKILARTGLPGEALQFEVTEDALMGDPKVAAVMLRRLSGLGATISIDDFGTGHSSLGRLKTLPIDELKIDRSFILGLTDDEDTTIVRSTIHLAHQMGLQVVAEGVETEAAWRQLRSMGCERAQGFLVAKPLPAREVPAWLATWNQRARELSSPRRISRRTAKAKAAEKPSPAAA